MSPKSSALLTPFTLNIDGSQSNLTLRSFGLHKNDLDIDFNQEFRPLLVTQLIQCCTTAKNDDEVLDQYFFWDLSVGKRIECLLIISTLGNNSISFEINCLNELCKKQIEFTISIKDLINQQNDTDKNNQCEFNLDNKSFLIRKPTGRDQLEWLNMSFTDKASALKEIIKKLIISDNKRNFDTLSVLLTEENIVAINQIMEKFDPLIDFHVQIICPYCMKENHYKIDLEEQSLIKLQQNQQNLIQSVHYIALKYHWNEQEIFLLPPWRRFEYLSLIKKEENQ